MNVRYLKIVLWGCRIIPIIIWVGFLILMLLGKELQDSKIFEAIALGVFVPCCMLYAILVYKLIPELLAEGQERTIAQKLRDYFLISVSAGLYMVFEYWKRVDSSLSKMIRKSKPEMTKKQDVISIIFWIVLGFGLIIGLVVSIIMTPDWTNEIKPNTDDFLEGLVKEDYEDVFKKYVINSPMDLEEFVLLLEKFNSKYGKIQSYEYKRSNSSYDGTTGTMTGHFLYYHIKTNTGNEFLTVFDITINKPLNQPYKDKFDTFEISDNQGMVLYFPLIKSKK